MEQKFHSLEDALQSFTKGDKDASGYLLERFYPGLILFADSLQPDHSRSELHVNNSWRKACRKHATFANLADLKTFLRKAIRRACTLPPNFLKPRRRSAAQKKEFAEFTSGNAETESPHASLIEKAMRHIGPQPLKTRVILELFFKYGKDPYEIARILGLTTQIVKARIEQALQSHVFMPDTDSCL